MNATCVNLKELFGDRFKIDVDESYYAERPEFRREEEPWLTHVVCQHGHIGVWGDDLLVASTRTPGPVATKLKALPFAQTAQDGSDGVNVVFPVEHFEEVAEIMKPRKRRRLSAEQRAANIERLAKYQFPSARQNAPEPRVCDGEGSRV